MMEIEELQPCDLIFSFASNHVVEHVALYAGMKDGVPYVLHATSAPHYAVMLTRLVEAEFGCYYRVMSPVNQALGLAAKNILLGWVEHKVPFASAEKQNKVYNIVEDLGGIDNPARSGVVQAGYGKSTYVTNYAQYLTMANYLPFIPEAYTLEGKQEGLRCAEAIVAAFNIALLMMHASQKEEREALEATDNLGDFIATLNSPLPFDAKAILPAGIYQHCIDSPMQWESCGVLNLPALPHPDEASKTDWREFRTSLELDAKENQSQFTASLDGRLSPIQCFRLTPGAGSPVAFPNRVTLPRSRSGSQSSSPSLRLSRSPIYHTFFCEQERQNSPAAAAAEQTEFTPIDSSLNSPGNNN